MSKTEGAIPKTMHGARAKLSLGGKPVGIFMNVSYGIQYDAQPIHILGKFDPAEIVLTGMEPVSVNATGFRVIGSEGAPRGPHGDALVPKLQDLLRHPDTFLTITDRQTGETILTVRGLRPTGYSTQLNARGLQEISVSFMGLVANDESGSQSDPGAAVY